MKDKSNDYINEFDWLSYVIAGLIITVILYYVGLMFVLLAGVS